MRMPTSDADSAQVITDVRSASDHAAIALLDDDGRRARAAVRTIVGPVGVLTRLFGVVGLAADLARMLDVDKRRATVGREGQRGDFAADRSRQKTAKVPG